MGSGVVPPPVAPQGQQPQDPQDPFAALRSGALQQSREANVSDDDAFAGLRNASLQAAGLQKYGLEWAGLMGMRVAKGIADTSLGAVDTASRGWMRIGQYLQHFAGVPDKSLIRDQGFIQRLTGKTNSDAYDVAQALGATSLGDLTPGEQRSIDGRQFADALRSLDASRLGEQGAAAASIAGELMGFATGPMGLVGKDAAAIGAAMSKPAANFFARQIAKGSMTADAVAQLAREGRLLETMAKEGGWAGKAVAAAPGVVGEYGALMAQTYARAPNGEGAAAVEHAAIPGFFFLGLGRGARWTANRALDATLSPAAKDGLLAVQRALENGTAGRWGQTWDALQSMPVADRLKVLGIGTSVAGAEALGFTLTDQDQIKDLIDGWAGDPQAMGRFRARWLGTTAGVLTMKAGMPLEAVPYFKRLAPDLNSYRLEKLRQQAAAEAKSGAEAAGQQAFEQAAAAGEFTERSLGERLGVPPEPGPTGITPEGETALEPQVAAHQPAKGTPEAEAAAKTPATLPEQRLEAAAQQAASDRAMGAHVDPLLRSGWDLEQHGLDQPQPEVRLTAPGGGHVVVRVPGAGSQPEVVVSPATWRAIRGSEEPPKEPESARPYLSPLQVAGGITLRGNHAQQFLTDLGLRTAVQKMRATLRLGRMGFGETAAGGAWRDPTSGIDYTFGIDGSLQRRSPFDKVWERVPDSDPLQGTLQLPVGEQVHTPTHWTGAMEKWSQFAFEKARSFPEPAVDEAIATAINTAQYGRQTESAMELRHFFETVDPMELASVFGPQDSKVMAHTIASIGAGLNNSEHAAAMVREQIPELAAGRRILWERRLAGDHGGGTLLEAPAEAPKPPEKPLDVRLRAEQALADTARPDLPPEAVGARVKVDAWLQGGGKDSPPKAAIELLEGHAAEARAAEQATHVNLTDLYGPSEVGSGLVIKQAAQAVGKGITKLAAILRKGRGGTPAGSAGAAYESSRKPLDFALEHKPFAVGKIGTREALEAQQMAHAGIDFGATQRAELEQMGAEDTLRKLGGHVGGGYREAAKWLGEEEEVKPGMFQTRFDILTDNGTTKAAVPPLAQELVDQHHALRMKTGEFAERVGTFRKNPNRGNKANEWEPFVTNKGRRISPRTDLQDDWFDLFDRPGAPNNEEALRKLAAANNLKDPDAFVKKVQEQADERVAKHETLDRSSAIEHARELQFVPDRMTLKDGTELQLRSGDPFEATKSMLESEIQANIGRAAFGQDLPAETRKQHPAYTKPGPEGAIARVRASVTRAGGTKAQTDKAEAIMRAQVNALEGRSPEGFVKRSTPLTRGIAGLEALRRGGKMVGGAVQDIFENLGNLQPGVSRVLRGLVSAGVHPVQAIRQAYRQGAVTRDTLFDRDTGLLKGGWRALSKVVSSPKRVSQRFSNAWSARSMTYLVRDLKAQANVQGSGGLLHRVARAGDAIFIRGLGFTEAETQAMVGGRASDDLYMKLIQRGTRMITGELQPSERSELADSKKFNALVAFARWPLNQARKSFRVIGQTVEAYRTGDLPTKIAASQKLLTYYFGATAAGLIGQYLGMWLANPAHPKDTLDQFAREMETEGWFSGILKRGLLQSVLGGPFALASGWLDRNRSVTENVANATVPGQVATEIGSAFLGQGAYKDQDLGGRLQTFLRRSYTGSKYLAGVGAAVGLTEDNGLQVALRGMNRWAQDHDKPFDGSGITPVEDQAFATAMRSLSQVVRDNATKPPEEIVALPEFQDAMRASLGTAQGDDIWRSLRSRRILDNRTPEDLDSMLKEIGEQSMQALYNHDDAMNRIAQAFRGEEGTPRHVLPELEARLAAAQQQIQLGNPGSVWRPILDEVMDDTAAKIRAGQQDFSDVAKIADAMSITPEKLTGLIGEREQQALMRASGPGAALMLRAFLMRQARERARNEIRKERKAERK